MSEIREIVRRLQRSDADADPLVENLAELARRDVVSPRLQRSDGDAVADPSVENLNGLIQSVAGASIEEIDRIILELQGVRDMLRNEGERVSRNLAGYPSLNHASMTAMKVIGDNLKQWKDATGPTAT
jgi:hypothetical protein